MNLALPDLKSLKFKQSTADNPQSKIHRSKAAADNQKWVALAKCPNE